MKDKILKNRYKIIKKIGSGGMAAVYKAEDTLLDRNVALKILRSQFADDEEFVKRFKREAKAAASLTHPNVVNIFDVGREDEHHFIVMECIYCKTLKQLICERAPLDVKEAVNITREISEALVHAHRNDIIHRDIKPHNILLTQEGRVKVTDFGIARAASEATITYQSGTVFGSAHYFSPEQARGGFTGEKSDIYSLGIVLYEMLTGELPFQGETPIAVALKHLQEEVKAPGEFNPSVPRAVEKITLKALAKEQASRYQTVEELLEDLKLWLNWSHSNESHPQNYQHQVANTPSLDDSPTREIPVMAGGNNSFSKSGSQSNAVSQNDFSYASSEESEENIVSTSNKSFKNNLSSSKTFPNKSNSNVVGFSRGEISNENNEGKNKRRKKSNKNKAPLIRNIIIVLIILAALGYGVNWGINKFMDFFIVPEVSVPEVEDISLSQAQEKLDQEGLDSSVAKEIPHPEVEAGYVINQDPVAGNVIRKTREVQLTISLGPEEIEIPDVIGMGRRQARIELEEEGLEVEIEEEYKSDVNRNEVFSQSPEAGYEASQGSRVILKVSKGGEPFEIPDFANRDIDIVEEEVEGELELSIRNVYEEEESPEGIVLDQWPDPGEEIKPGDSVDFWVSDGKSKEELKEEYEVKEIEIDELSEEREIKVVVDDEVGERVIFEGEPEGESMIFEGYEEGVIEVEGFDEDGGLISSRMLHF